MRADFEPTGSGYFTVYTMISKRISNVICWLFVRVKLRRKASDKGCLLAGLQLPGGGYDLSAGKSSAKRAAET
jgi:hypothetical protein